MHAHSPGTAWLQGAMLVAVAAALALAMAARAHQPFDRDTLAIQVSRLQSHAAEAALLTRNAHAGRLAPGFVRRHAQQLADKVDDVGRALQSKRAAPGLDGARASAVRLGSSLHAGLQRLSRNGHPPPEQALGFGSLARGLDALHTRLEPAG